MLGRTLKLDKRKGATEQETSLIMDALFFMLRHWLPIYILLEHPLYNRLDQQVPWQRRMLPL
jgi:hypothetical protein